MCSSTSYFTGPNKIVLNSRMFVSAVTSGVTHSVPFAFTRVDECSGNGMGHAWCYKCTEGGVLVYVSILNYWGKVG